MRAKTIHAVGLGAAGALLAVFIGQASASHPPQPVNVSLRIGKHVKVLPYALAPLPLRRDQGNSNTLLSDTLLVEVQTNEPDWLLVVRADGADIPWLTKQASTVVQLIDLDGVVVREGQLTREGLVMRGTGRTGIERFLFRLGCTTRTRGTVGPGQVRITLEGR
jgi:hypothetical protein